MSEELQTGKYEFVSNNVDNEYDKLLAELELLSLSDAEREKRRQQVAARLAQLDRERDIPVDELLSLLG